MIKYYTITLTDIIKHFPDSQHPRKLSMQRSFALVQIVQGFTRLTGFNFFFVRFIGFSHIK